MVEVSIVHAPDEDRWASVLRLEIDSFTCNFVNTGVASGALGRCTVVIVSSSFLDRLDEFEVVLRKIKALYRRNFARRCIFLKWQEEVDDTGVLDALRDRGYDVSPFPLVDWGGHITESQQAFPLLGQGSAVVSPLITRIREALSSAPAPAAAPTIPQNVPTANAIVEPAAANELPSAPAPAAAPTTPQNVPTANAIAEPAATNELPPAPAPAAPTTPRNVPTANAIVEPAAANELPSAPAPATSTTPQNVPTANAIVEPAAANELPSAPAAPAAPTTPRNVPTANAIVEPAAANETATATPPVAVAEPTAAHDSPVPSIGNNNNSNASVVIHIHIPSHAAGAAPDTTSTTSSSASPPPAAAASNPTPITPAQAPATTATPPAAVPSATSVPPPPVPPTASTTTSSASPVPAAATPAPAAPTAAQQSSEAAAAAAAATALTFRVHDLIERHAKREGQVAGLLWRGNLRCFPEIKHGAVVERVEEPSGGRILVTKNNSLWGKIGLGALVGANVHVTLKDAVTNAVVGKFRLGTKYDKSIAAQIEVLWFDADHVRFARQCCGKDLGACVCLAVF
eukprot:gene24734-29885_t